MTSSQRTTVAVDVLVLGDDDLRWWDGPQSCFILHVYNEIKY